MILIHKFYYLMNMKNKSKILKNFVPFELSCIFD